VTGENRIAAALREAALGADALRAADALLELGLANDAVSRAYYAAFHHARALLLMHNLDPKTHRGVIASLERVSATGELPSDDVSALARLQTFRGLADYDSSSRITPERATGEVAAARSLVDRLRVALRQLGCDL
jgi:uncharacterized protein